MQSASSGPESGTETQLKEGKPFMLNTYSAEKSPSVTRPEIPPL